MITAILSVSIRCSYHQHDDFIQPADDSEAAQLKADEEMLGIIRNDVVNILMPRVIASIHHEKYCRCLTIISSIM